MMKVNPMELIQMIKSGKNPQQLVLSILENEAGSTPMGKNLLALAKNNKTKEIEQIARNYYGKDFDKEFNAFKHSLGL